MSPTGVYPRPLMPERLLSKIIKSSEPDGCWLWKDKLSKDGYAYFWVGQGGKLGKNVPAHRVLYELMIGKIPEGCELDHLCKNPACVRPDHQEPVTHRINLLRGEGVAAKNAAATHCPQGHPYDLQNTYFTKEGWRGCRQCRFESVQRFRSKQKKEVAK